MGENIWHVIFEYSVLGIHSKLILLYASIAAGLQIRPSDHLAVVWSTGVGAAVELMADFALLKTSVASLALQILLPPFFQIVGERTQKNTPCIGIRIVSSTDFERIKRARTSLPL